ncbi:MAG: PcfJ domain-containing protein [Verrucomicrobia bacterium]|nr:PcfJ domain-containing protein [Verrucomicrobiota bacterium]
MQQAGLFPVEAALWRQATQGVEVKDGKLYRFAPGQALSARVWPEPAAWLKKRDSETWLPHEPHLDCAQMILERKERKLDMCRLFGTEQTVRRVTEWRPRPDDPPRRRQAVERRNDEQRKVREYLLVNVPAEVREWIGPYPIGQWRILRMIAHCPRFLDLVQCNPALAFALASYEAFRPPACVAVPRQLELFPEKIQVSGAQNPMETVRQLIPTRQRDLCGWLGFQPTESTVKILRKLPAGSCSIPILLRLRTALTCGWKMEFCRKLPALNTSVICALSERRLAGRLTLRFLTDLLAPARAVDDAQREDAEVENTINFGHVLRDTLWMLRHLKDFNLPARIHSRRKLLEIHNLLAREFMQVNEDALLALQFPPPPVEGDGNIEPVDSPQKLLEEGRVQENCVAGYGNWIAKGCCYIYRIHAPERATVCLWRERRGGWMLNDLEAGRNQGASAETFEAIEEWFQRQTIPF